MTKWIFSKDSKGMLITKEKEGKRPLKIGYSGLPDLTNAFFEVSGKFEPGDLVVTPEGTNFVFSRQGWFNN